MTSSTGRVVPGVAGEHLAHRVERLDGELLQDDAELAAQPSLPAAIAGVDSQDRHLAAVAIAEALEDLDRARLAGAVGPE